MRETCRLIFYFLAPNLSTLNHQLSTFLSAIGKHMNSDSYFAMPLTSDLFLL
jgi:hypothetical protein